MPVDMAGKAIVRSCSSSATRIDSVWQLASVSASRCRPPLQIWPDRVNHVFCSQPSCGSGNRLARRQPALAGDDCSARLKNRRTSGAMDGAIHTASSHERRVRGIDDGIAGFARDVARALYDEQAVG